MVWDIFRTTLMGNLVPGKNSYKNDPHSLNACRMRSTILSALNAIIKFISTTLTR